MAKKKHTNRQAEVSIEIGGGVGPASAIGKDNHVKAHNVAGGNITQDIGEDKAGKENFLKMIQELQVRITQFEEQFDKEDLEDVKSVLGKVEQLAVKEKPPVERIKRDLETVSEIVKDTAAVGAKVAPLLPLVQQAWEAFLHLF